MADIPKAADDNGQPRRRTGSKNGEKQARGAGYRLIRNSVRFYLRDSLFSHWVFVFFPEDFPTPLSKWMFFLMMSSGSVFGMLPRWVLAPLYVAAMLQYMCKSHVDFKLLLWGQKTLKCSA
ncbi:hypothetical protein V1522DRAFT_377293 [Lipomyces starkeyi]